MITKIFLKHVHKTKWKKSHHFTEVIFLEASSVQFSSVQLLSRVQLFETPWITARQASLSITNSRSSPRLTSIGSVKPSSHLILCRPLFLLPPIPPSIKVFSNESTLRMRWPKYWSFSFSIIPSKEHPGLISFRMDWLDLLAVQGILNIFFFFFFCYYFAIFYSIFFKLFLMIPWIMSEHILVTTRELKSFYQRDEKQGKI